ncbi:MAG: HAD family phosphatase [Leptospirales bacterium]
MRPARAIIFDAEGVIIDTEALWDESQRVFLERRGIAYDRARTKHLLAGRSLTDGTRILKDAYKEDLAGEIRELAAERRDITASLFAAGVELIPGFADFFERVTAAKFTTCVATSMAPDLFALADRRLKLSDRFSGRVFFTADVGGRAKPDPAVFLHAAKALACPPRDCLVIEDSPAGVLGARAAGMQCVALTTTFSRERLRQADLICDAFDEIPEISPAPGPRNP